MLSSVTRLAGVVTLPRQSHAALSQIEFVPLSDNRVLAILVVNGREVQNRILQLERHFSADELRRASNYLNKEFGGKELSAVRDHLLAQLKETREHLNEMMLDAIHLAQQVMNVPVVGGGRMEYVIAGETNLMGFAELSNVEKLRRLFEAFTQQRDILHLLDQSLRAEGVQIFIGQESGYTILDDCSVVTAPYSLDQEVVGVLGRHRPDAHGLRARDPDRRHHREAAGLRLEFAGLSRNSRRCRARVRPHCDNPCRATARPTRSIGEGSR